MSLQALLQIASDEAKPLLMNAFSSKISSKTNWEKVLTKTDEEIDFSDCPELDAQFFARPSEATLATVTLGVEPDVLAWFRAQGEEGDQKMRAALRIYVQAHQ